MLVENYKMDFELAAWEYQDRQALWESLIRAEFEQADTSFWNAVDAEMRGE
jgi:hypothetical protein